MFKPLEMLSQYIYFIHKHHCCLFSSLSIKYLHMITAGSCSDSCAFPKHSRSRSMGLHSTFQNTSINSFNSFLGVSSGQCENIHIHCVKTLHICMFRSECASFEQAWVHPGCGDRGRVSRHRLQLLVQASRLDSAAQVWQWALCGHAL